MQKEIRESITLENEGLKLFGILHRPEVCASGVQVPCVVLLHGLGGNKSGRYRMITRLAEALAKNGIAAFRLDSRGAGDSEGNFSDTTLHTLTSDALLALEYVSTHPSINSRMLALCGRSFGGAVAVNAAAQFHVNHPESLRAIALWASVFDAKPWLVKKNDSTERATAHLFMGEPLSGQFIAQFSAYNAVDCLQHLGHIPMLVIQGQKDVVVDAYHMDQYVLARKNSAHTAILSLPNTDHEFSHVAEQIQSLDETVDFMKKVFYDK